MAEKDVKRLAAAIVEARGDLRMSQEDFAARGSLGLKTLQRLEKAHTTPQGATLTGLDQAAGWPPGTARAILNGTGERPASNNLRRTTVRYHGPDAGEIDEKAILQRMIELIPSIRKRYGNDQADLMIARIWALAVESNLVDFASAHLQEYAAQ